MDGLWNGVEHWATYPIHDKESMIQYSGSMIQIIYVWYA